MEKNLFEKLDPLVEELAEEVNMLVDGPALSKIKRQLTDVSRELGGYSLTLEMNVQVFDPEREQNLPLIQTGLATSAGDEPYQVWADSTPQRYIVNGAMAIVPHDHCPACWGRWDFKELHPSCPDCGVAMGEEVKLLLDTDCCPRCEKGTVTATQSQCTECGFSVNPDHVSWG